jgi:hypothetical protein
MLPVQITGRIPIASAIALYDTILAVLGALIRIILTEHDRQYRHKEAGTSMESRQ